MSETIWGIIITGVLTLGASLGSIILANEFNNRRFKEQLTQDRDLKKAELDHDRELTKREREMSLRKEIYLAAAEAVHAGLTAINRFAHLEIPNDKLIEGYLDKAPSIAKVHIIAKDETVKAIVTFSATLDMTFVRLFARRDPLVLEKRNVDGLRAQAQTSRQEHARTTEQLRQYNLDGLSDQRRLDVLKLNLEFEQKQSAAATREADALAVTLYLKQLQLMEDSMDEKNKLVRLLIPVVFSIRKELELPIEEGEYRRVLEAAASEQLQIFREYLQQQRAAWGGGLPPPAA